MKFRGFLMAVMVVILAAAGVVVAGEGAPKAQESGVAAAAPEATLPVGAGGKMVFVDPATGRVTGTPSAEQRAAMKNQMANLFSQSDEGTYDEFLPNGAVLRDLQGRFINATVVRIAPDGSHYLECTTDPEHTLRGDAQSNTEPVAPTVVVK